MRVCLVQEEFPVDALLVVLSDKTSELLLVSVSDSVLLSVIASAPETRDCSSSGKSDNLSGVN